MTSPALRLLARIVPVVAIAGAACGGETASPTAETPVDGGGAGGKGGTGGSSAGTGGTSPGTGGSSAGTGGSGGTIGLAGTGGSSAGTGGTGGTGGLAGTGGTSAGTGGTGGLAGTGGTIGLAGTGGAGGSDAGAGGSAGAGGLPACDLPKLCEDKCYDRVGDETCLVSHLDAEAIQQRLGCTTHLWGSVKSESGLQCCYMSGQCGVGRPITVAGVALTAELRRETSWAC